MNSRFCVVLALFILLIFSGVCCTSIGQQTEEEKIARSYCSSCHLFPEPYLLDTTTWVKGVLPHMAEYFGIKYLGNTYFVDDIDTSGNPAAHSSAVAQAYEKWTAIINYYTANAPAKLDTQNRAPVQHFTNLFQPKEAIIKGNHPTATYTHIDPGNQRVYMSHEHDSTFYIFDKELHLLSKKNIQGVLADLLFTEDIHQPGERHGIATDIGIIYPNDLKRGALKKFYITANASFNYTGTITDKMPRPVQTNEADLDGDGKKDYLVCGFGYTTGAFYYMRQIDSNHYEQKMLKALPGAIRAYIDDYNEDGLPDIIVLFAQADEGIYVYLNKGKGNFEMKELMRFPSVYGSTYFELIDVNKDGLKDILYICGDNLDFSQVPKFYHGIYIYLNKGNGKYEQAYFFPMYGCYKALMRDFDKDGDLDIAAISYFPDVKNRPQESLLYLECKGGLNFQPYSIKGYNRGNWVTMDAGDADGDGDEDLVIGSLIFNNTPRELTMAAGTGDLPSLLLLVNQTK